MPEQVTVKIVRVADNVPIDATVVPVMPEHLAQARAWRTALVSEGEPDHTWDWTAFLEEAHATEQAGRGRFEALALTVEGEVQATW